jgi:hypothetical protein
MISSAGLENERSFNQDTVNVLVQVLVPYLFVLVKKD